MASVVDRWQIRKVPFSSVKPLPENARVISDASLAALEVSLDRFGYVEPIVWNERTGHIVGGHQRYDILAESGVSEASMVVVDMSHEDEIDASLALNNPKIEGTWDDSAVTLLEQVEEADDALFRSLRMDALKESLENSSRKKDVPQGVDVTDAGREHDTECPCCGHKWMVGPDDVVVGGGDPDEDIDA